MNIFKPAFLVPLFTLTALVPLVGFGQIKTDSPAHKKMLSMEKRVVNTYATVLDSVVCLQSIQNGGSASGSGTIVSKDGLILTAAHVVGKAENVIVQLVDGRTVSGKVLGCNYERDVAMVQITVGEDEEAQEWPFVEIGDSSDWDVADFYIAMGHPGGFNIRRPPPVRIGRAYNSNSNKFIVTDCVVIGGDSGGPLFDLDGNLIGIHSSIGAGLGQNNHAPVHIVQEDWDRFLTGDKWGTASGMRLSQGGQDSGPPRLGMKLEPGDSLTIAKVHSGSVMEQAGVEDGDIIVAVDGKRLRNKSALVALAKQFKRGQEVEFEVKRDGKSLTKLIRFPGPKAPNPPEDPEDGVAEKPGKPAYFGAAFRTTDKGARISRVVKDGPAEKAKLKADDVIYEIEGKDIGGPSDIATLLRGQRAGDKIEIHFYRDGEEDMLTLTLGEK